MSTTTVQDLSLEHFNALMDMVDNHASTALGMISTGFSGPLPALSLGTLTEDATAASAEGRAAALATLPRAAGVALKSHRDTTVKTLNVLKQHSKSTTAAHVKKIQAGQNTDPEQKKFEADLDARAKKNVADYTKDQETIKEKLKAIGRDNPAARSAIVAGFGEVSDVLISKIHEITVFFIGFGAKVIQLVARAVQFIEDKVGGIVTGIGNALSSLNPF
jgi:hypothetical protein